MNQEEKNIDLMQDKTFQNLVKQAYDCLECGKCTGGCPMVYLFPGHFNPHHVLEELAANPEKTINMKDFWYCASCYTCNKKCPQGIELPDIFLTLRKYAIQQNGTKVLAEVLENLKKQIPFANTFFRVCYHPERIPLDDKIVDMLTESAIDFKKTYTVQSTGKSVAIIGAGPAGLYAAWLLAAKGHQVTIYESSEDTGGMLSRCIPEFRLPKETVNHEADLLRKMNITIKNGVIVGKDITLNELKTNHQSTLIATGAHKCIKLNIEGEHLKGVMNSLEFLEAVKTGRISDLNSKQVMVIGGGNTAMDVASVAVRAGALTQIIYRRSKNEIPADINEIREAVEEGAKIEYLMLPVKFNGNKTLESVECIKVELGSPDFTGRKSPIPIEGSNFTISADYAVVSIGEKPAIDFLPEQIEISRRRTIAIDPLTMHTSMEGVFAAGDAVLGPSTVSQVIMMAAKAVVGIDKYLKSL